MDCAPHLVIAEVLPFRTGLVAHHASEHAAGWRREVERIVVDRMFGEERLVRFECCTDARFITEGKCAVVAGADPFVRVLADEGDEFLIIASLCSGGGDALTNKRARVTPFLVVLVKRPGGAPFLKQMLHVDDLVAPTPLGKPGRVCAGSGCFLFISPTVSAVSRYLSH